MDQRHKNGLRPRPKLRLGGVVPESAAAKGHAAGSRPSVMQAPVLVLNATFEPINVTAVRRALVLLAERCGPSRRNQSHRSPFHEECHPGSFGHSAAELPAYSTAKPRAIAQKHFAARPQHLPVLHSRVSSFGADARSRDAAFARRAFELGESGGLLLRLQQSQGRPDTGRGGVQAAAPAASFHAAHFAAADAIDRKSRREVA